MSKMLSSAVKLESGIPVPPRGAGGSRPSIYRWSEMAVGDSFTVETAKLNSIKVLIHRQHKTTDRRFIWRTLSNGKIRVWRDQ